MPADAPAPDGPSPRVRGSHGQPALGSHWDRSIPACAGKPTTSPGRRTGTRVHPRVCGESPGAAVVQESLEGSIPACAGKPGNRRGTATRGRVHPRVCGEASATVRVQRFNPGPSPRVRGSRWAGPRPPPPSAGAPEVHPRVCGEARMRWSRVRSRWGPSPRVRGSPRAPASGHASPGSIPACAGKPFDAELLGTIGRVHPRVCGEALTGGRARKEARGPSPRVRGSRPRRVPEDAACGSIPACAGKPDYRRWNADQQRVHPRVCGEAGAILAPWHVARGPSPRVRGSRERPSDAVRGEGSIPACAGKPVSASTPCGSCRVHPRVCGEAGRLEGRGRPAQGPSPRVRGSHCRTIHPREGDGSIPACAGKPAPGRRPRTDHRVHPRVCGEASSRGVRLSRWTGPSPRVRGSPALEPAGVVARGSIPACAGKPSVRRSMRTIARVHPRVCGEASRRHLDMARRAGPSPRVRGSPEPAADDRLAQRSIPACAGKPPIPSASRGSCKVHPRVCGEASRSGPRA